MRIVNYTDARNGLKGVLDQVIDDADVTVITRRDAPDAVVMSKQHYDGMMETLYLLRSPKNAERLLQSVADIRAGKAKVRGLIEPSEQNDESAETSRVP
jgi:antitoxin YefM